MQKIIVGLVALNLALIVYLAVAVGQRGKGTENAAAVLSNSSPADTSQKTFSARSATSKPARSAEPEKLTWASLASRDLRKYAENLRRVGCPEETIKEILLAEAKRLYGPREQALRARPDDIAPWETAALYDRRNAETKLRQLLEEKRALLKELTGVDVGLDMPSRLAGRDVQKFEAAFAGLPETTRDQVRAIQETYWAQSDDIKQRTMGYLEPEDRDEFLRIKTERREALSKLLSPSELQEYEMQISDTTPNLKSRFQGFEVTDDELRKVFDFMQPLDDQYSLSRRNPDPVDKEFTASRDQAEKDLQQHIQSVLGEDRYAEYQRTRDPVYRNLKQVGTEAGVPQESILQAYETQQQMQAESRRIMRDTSLTPDQRMESLRDLHAQAQQTAQQLFGDKAAQILQKFPNIRMAERYGLPVGDSGPAQGLRVENIGIPQP